MDAPRISQTSANGDARREQGFSDVVIQELTDLGHNFYTPPTIGSVQTIIVDKRGHRKFGAADKRRIGGVGSVRRSKIAD